MWLIINNYKWKLYFYEKIISLKNNFQKLERSYVLGDVYTGLISLKYLKKKNFSNYFYCILTI